MLLPFCHKSARILVSDPVSSRKTLISDVLRALGFTVSGFTKSGAEALRFLEQEQVDWILMPLNATDSINALHLLKLIQQDHRLRHIRISLFTAPDEEYCLPLAFELGLFSAHPTSYQKDDIESELKELLRSLAEDNWSETLTSARYLRKTLKKLKSYKNLLALENTLISMFPGTVPLLINLAEAQFLTGKHEEATISIGQAYLIDDSLKPQIDRLLRVMKDCLFIPESFTIPDFQTKAPSLPAKSNALGIKKSCDYRL